MSFKGGWTILDGLAFQNSENLIAVIVGLLELVFNLLGTLAERIRRRLWEELVLYMGYIKGKIKDEN